MRSIDALVGLCAVSVVLLVVRGSGRARTQKDPRRNFTTAQRAEGFARARNQCEHVNVFGRRCTNAPTHGDHHYPHSKGGATTLSNFVALFGLTEMMGTRPRTPDQRAGGAGALRRR